MYSLFVYIIINPVFYDFGLVSMSRNCIGKFKVEKIIIFSRNG